MAPLPILKGISRDAFMGCTATAGCYDDVAIGWVTDGTGVPVVFNIDLFSSNALTVITFFIFPYIFAILGVPSKPPPLFFSSFEIARCSMDLINRLLMAVPI